MAKRSGVSTRTRFEVFKRDAFRCQYCGREAPDVVLQADHVVPVSEGGGNGLTNLVTSCFECNSGKSNKSLDDGSAVKLVKKQLNLLNERRQQIEMMAKWKIGMEAERDLATRKAAEFWNSKITGYHLNEYGLSELRKTVRKFGLCAVLDAMSVSAETYLRWDADGKITNESVAVAGRKIGGIAFLRKQESEDPSSGVLRHAKSILLLRFHYLTGWEVMAFLKVAQKQGTTAERLLSLASSANSWATFQAEANGEEAIG